jgi:hypothetical protein
MIFDNLTAEKLAEKITEQFADQCKALEFKAKVYKIMREKLNNNLQGLNVDPSEKTVINFFKIRPLVRNPDGIFHVDIIYELEIEIGPGVVKVMRLEVNVYLYRLDIGLILMKLMG